VRNAVCADAETHCERWGDQWSTPEHIVSNGPFLLQKHENRVISVLKKNPRYFDAQNVYLETITVHHTESDQTAFDWYEVGKTPMAWRCCAANRQGADTASLGTR